MPLRGTLGGVAQLGERDTGSVEVMGSSPTVSSMVEKKAKTVKVNPLVACLSVILCLLILVAVCAVIYRIATGGRVVTVPLNDYVSVTFEGYDGQGEAEASFDTERFLNDYSERIKLTGKAKKLAGDDSEVGLLVLALGEDGVPASVIPLLFENGTLTPTNGLKNGDETVFSWNLTDSVKQALKDYLGCVPEAPDLVSFTEGLDDVKPVDLFEGLTLRFTGGEPNGLAEIDMPSSSEYAGELEYTIEPAEGLSNDDTVTVTVSYAGGDLNTYLAEEHGVRAKEEQMTFTVEGLSTYAQSYADITDEAIRRMEQKGMAVIEEYYDADPETFGDSLLEPAGALFLLAKDPESLTQGYNGVVMLYHAEVMVTVWEDGLDYIGHADYYTCVSFFDIETDEFGASTVDTDTAEMTTNTFVYNIPDTYLEGEGWLSHNLRGYETMADMLADCDSMYGYDYTISDQTGGNFSDGDTDTDEIPQRDRDNDTTEDDLQEGELQDEPQDEPQDDGQGTLEEEEYTGNTEDETGNI